MKRLAILLTTSLLSVCSFGQSLSKQDVIDLKKTGLDKTVIIQQIQKDGISLRLGWSVSETSARFLRTWGGSKPCSGIYVALVECGILPHVLLSSSCFDLPHG